MRIISGTARGRKLLSPEGKIARPTLDRVREALFGIIQFDIPGARVLDLFAGSGALGLEALSRGAAYALFNDRDPRCEAVVRKNVASLGFSSMAQVMRADYAACIKRLASDRESFDILFIDAPYADGTGIIAAKLSVSCGILDSHCIIALEHSANEIHELDGFLPDRRKYGTAGVTLFRPAVQTKEM